MKWQSNRLSGARRLLFSKAERLPVFVLALFAGAFLWDCSQQLIGAVIHIHPPACEEGEQICLSLKVLAREAEADLHSGGPLREEVETLAGINWVEGFVVDQKNNDVILVGRACPDRPPLYLDDLVVNIRNVWKSNEYSYCSLDPRAEDVLKVERILSASQESLSLSDMRELFSKLEESVGPQQIVVGGIPRNSRQAHVMIDADYEMKKVSQGHIELEGVTSCLDRSLVESKATSREGISNRRPRISRSRFWFHLQKGDPKFVESRGIVYLDQCAVVVLTEKQKATADGELYDDEGIDPHARAFAQEFSDSFSKATKSVPVYADLEQLYRLNALIQAMYFRQASRKVGLDLEFFVGRYQFQKASPMPPSKPGLANYREASERVADGANTYEQIFFPMVCGGVSMEIPVRPGQFYWKLGGWLPRLHSKVVKTRPHVNSLCWILS